MSITTSYTQISPYTTVQEGTDGSMTVTEHWTCAWADLAVIRRELLGDPINLIPTHVHPDYPQAYVRTVQHEALAPPATEGSTPDEAHLTITWASGGFEWPEVIDKEKTFNIEPASELLRSRSYRPGVEFITLPNKKLYWDSAAKVELLGSEAPSFHYRFWEIVLTFYKVSTIPIYTLSYAGCVNNSAVPDNFWNVSYAAGTLLFLGGEPEIMYNSDGDVIKRLTLRFRARAFNWNKWFRAGYEDPQIAYRAAATQFVPYPQVDLSLVFPTT